MIQATNKRFPLDDFFTLDDQRLMIQGINQFLLESIPNLIEIGIAIFLKRIDFNQRMDFFVKFLEISLTTQVKQKFSKRIQIMIKIPTRTGFILNKS